MTTMQIKAEAFQNLGIIAQDKTVLERVAKYLRRVAKQLTDDPTCMTKEEFFANVDEAMEQAKRGQVHRMRADESLDEFLKRES